jgi:hypothetical protein
VPAAKENVMSDDLENRGPADRNRVNVNEAWELRYWCKHFDCTADELRAAVKAAGSTLKSEVEAALKRIKKK